MELILDLLRRLPDYPRLRTALESTPAVGVSGAAQINRSHLIAALCRDTARPAVVVCQDEMAARRTQSACRLPRRGGPHSADARPDVL